MYRLYADRQRLSAMVVENLLPSNEGVEEGDTASGPQNLNTITLQLEENLKEEQRFNCCMLYTVFKLGLNPVQVSIPAQFLKCLCLYSVTYAYSVHSQAAQDCCIQCIDK